MIDSRWEGFELKVKVRLRMPVSDGRLINAEQSRESRVWDELLIISPESLVQNYHI